VRIGDTVEVSGTVAADEQGQVVGADDPYRQCYYALEKALAAARQAGAQLEDTIRTRIYIVDFAHYEDIARAHKELLGDVKPASTMVQIAALVSPEYLVEVELTAIIRQPAAEPYLV
jgi:enamine deaminase RidA (YjgF/YER057c/UK114 family)